MTYHKRLLLLTLLIALSACGSISVEDYAGQAPIFNPQEFFDGDLLARGVLKNRSGLVIRRFSADINAYWRDGVGTLEEDFIFDDGEESRRVWTLTPAGEGRYTATAGDVVGEGVASVAGNAMFLDYVLRVPYGDGDIDLSIDDRMYLLTSDLLINESQMRKFGFRVGEIVLTIEKQQVSH
ncbi:DUF3833 domain-containing protein [Congregibacter variabilis]|uniref:DUF3833 domain-containing protein n=1 Tax=Congregibacter variabilis TaxID=3081200 RepID=A0ABZ0I6I6_9GAMM|nr:DUF3833 domain-containing protein [Congregibacter sp. IMCC43200]